MLPNKLQRHLTLSHLQFVNKPGDLVCEDFLKRKFNSGNSTNFWNTLNNECPALTKKAIPMVMLSPCRIYAKQDFLPWP